MHWGYGIFNGALYGIVAGSLPTPRAPRGREFVEDDNRHHRRGQSQELTAILRASSSGCSRTPYSVWMPAQSTVRPR